MLGKYRNQGLENVLAKYRRSMTSLFEWYCFANASPINNFPNIVGPDRWKKQKQLSGSVTGLKPQYELC